MSLLIPQILTTSSLRYAARITTAHASRFSRLEFTRQASTKTRTSIHNRTLATMTTDPKHFMYTSGETNPVWVHSVLFDSILRFSKLNSSLETDVCIVGAGISGISVAYELVTRKTQLNCCSYFERSCNSFDCQPTLARGLLSLRKQCTLIITGFYFRKMMAVQTVRDARYIDHCAMCTTGPI
jgi:hypothetical protein